MAVGIFPADWLSLCTAAHLGKLRKRVVLGQKAHHRLSVSVGGLKGRGHSGNAHLHCKALLLQDLLVQLCRFELMEACLRKIKDPVADLHHQILLPADGI